jgi:hypothetical protein
LGQAKEREFLDIKRSIELTPGFMPDKDLLPGRWRLRAMTMHSLLTHSRIRAISVDAKGEAGGAAAMSIFTELWGFDTPDAIKFWEEMTPAPTIPDSMRFVETYAGYDDGQSELLWNLYDLGKHGRQLTAGELAAEVCREDVPGETFQDFVNGWSETNGDPEVKIPVWRNDQSSIIMYWDSGEQARRMPWQHNYAGDFSDPNSLCGICMAPPGPHSSPTWASDYYRGEMAQPPNAFRRHHLNEWVGAESAFVDIALWDACGREHDRQGWNPIERLVPGDRTPLIVACDAAVSGDCFGIVAISRCPYDSSCVDIRGYKKWDPKETGGVVQFTGEPGDDTPENFIRESCELFNVTQVTYDPFQLEDMMQRLRRDFVSWVEPFNQGSDRLKADSQLYDLITNRRIHHTNNEEIREHVANANAKLQTDEDSKLRIVKKKNGKKIDLCVATSMASARCLYLLLA